MPRCYSSFVACVVLHRPHAPRILPLKRSASCSKKYAAYDQLNGAVLVAHEGKVIFKKGYGYADFEWDIPNTTDTKFRLASVTKQFTAMLILQLSEKES